MLDWLSELAWQPGKGSDFENQRPSLADIVHQDEFMIALRRLNPGAPDQYLLQAQVDIPQPRSQDALTENKAFPTIWCTDSAALSTPTPAAARRPDPAADLAQPGREHLPRCAAGPPEGQPVLPPPRRCPLEVNGFPLAIVE